jgi:Domain of unknown function (DUF4412)
MRKRLIPTLFALLLACGPVFGQFEGVLQMKMTMAAKDGQSGAGGTMNISVGKAGTRCEMNMQSGAMGMKMVMLQKNDAPNTLYRVNDANKTYTEMDVARMQAGAGQPQQAADKYTVEKLGQETLLGYKTEHVLLKKEGADPATASTTELWTAKDLLDYATFSKMQAVRGRLAGNPAMMKALQEAGADGMPLKSITTMPDGGKMTMEVTTVEKKTLPASTFEIPAGYTKSEGGMMDMMGGLSGPQADEARQRMAEAQQKMQEAMKNMTPEQRAMLEKMMKQRQGGTP